MTTGNSIGEVAADDSAEIFLTETTTCTLTATGPGGTATIVPARSLLSYWVTNGLVYHNQP